METGRLSPERDAIAPDGSEVRRLVRTERASMAHFQLGAGQVSVAVRHRTIEELWFFLTGRGEMWRRNAVGEEETVVVEVGTALSIPVGCAFQFRSLGDVPLTAVAASIPPFPIGDHDEVSIVDGPWSPSAGPGSHPVDRD